MFVLFLFGKVSTSKKYDGAGKYVCSWDTGY